MQQGMLNWTRRGVLAAGVAMSMALGATAPATAQTPPGVQALTLQTTLQNGITISDLPGPTGGIMIKSATGATLIVNDTGIYIQNGKGAAITLVGPTVTVNNGALTVV